MQSSSEELYLFHLTKKFQLPNIPKNKINNSGILCWPHMTIHSSISSIILHVQMDPYLTKKYFVCPAVRSGGALHIRQHYTTRGSLISQYHY